MYAVVFAKSNATVTLKCGSSSSTFTVTPGVNKLKNPLAAGKMSVQMVRNGKTIINETAKNYKYVLNPPSCASSFFYLLEWWSGFLI
jgi:glucan endo-1,3-alpha-glucosidase